MKLLYLANLRLLTEKAYGIQIAKTCEAFALTGVEVTLIFPYRRNPDVKQDLFSYYSVQENFKVKQLPALDFSYNHKPAVGVYQIFQLVQARGAIGLGRSRINDVHQDHFGQHLIQ